MNRIRRVIVVLGFLVLSAGIQNALAATPASGPPATSQGGANTFIEPPSSESGQTLLFQQYGIQDYTGITGANGSGGIGELNAPNDVGNIFATIWAGSLYVIGFIATRLVEWAFSLDIVSSLGGVIDQFTHSLEGGFYGPYLPVVLLIAAAICAYLLLVTTRFMRGIGGLLWAGAAVALATQLFISPAGMLDQVDGYTTGVTQAFVMGAAQDTGTNPNSFYNPSDATNYEVQVLANQLWTVAVYDPWTMVEFGSVDPRVNGDQLGVELLKQNDGQPNNYNQDIQQAPQWMEDWANGNQGVPRMLFAGAVALSGLLMLFLTVLIALAVIVAQLAVILMGCLTLPFWLLAPLPVFGMRLVMKWIAGIVVGFAVSTIGTLYLILVLVLLGAVNSLAAQVGLITVGLLDIALLVVALWLRKTMFSIGKHTARLPMALANVSPGEAGHEVDAPHAVVRHSHATMGSAGRSVIKPLYPQPQAALPASSSTTPTAMVTSNGAARAAVSTGAKKAATAAAGKAAIAKSGAGVAGKTGASAAGTAGLGAATAGGAVAAYAALRTGQAGIQAYEGLRRRTVSAVSGHLGHPIAPGEQPLRHEAKDPLVAHAVWQYGQHLHRVSKGGTKPLQGQRVKPLDGEGKGPVHAGPAPSIVTTTQKGKTRTEPKK